MLLRFSALLIMAISLFMSDGKAWGQTAYHAANDISPTLVLQSAPSDNADYRRMVYVHFLSADRVKVAYKAYNRTEFIQTAPAISAAAINNCSQGSPTPFDVIKAFEAEEARRAQSGQAPKTTLFCIKGVSGWEAGNRALYLDPIFNGMPYAATMK